MCGEAWARSLPIGFLGGLLLAGAGGTGAFAGDAAAPGAPALSAPLSAPAAQPAIQVPAMPGPSAAPPPKAPVPEPRPVGASGDPQIPDAPGMPDVLKEISQRQTELAILELDLKRAELQKKMRDLEAPSAAVQPPALGGGGGGGAAASPSPAAVIPGYADMSPSPLSDGAAGPVVQRIHRVNGSLCALIVLPGGESRDLPPGAEVIAGMRVVAITPDKVLVRSGDRAVHALPSAGTRHFGG